MKINEIFTSIDGEVNNWGQGVFTTFVRFHGCSLRCSYCDSKYALTGNSFILMDVDQVIHVIESKGCKKVTFTGGEPLLQLKELTLLIRELKQEDYKISIETNNTVEIPAWMKIDPSISLVIDYKLDYVDKMVLKNFKLLCNRHFIKFVVGSEKDIIRSLSFINVLRMKATCLPAYARFAISPLHGKIEPKQIVEFLKENNEYNVYLNMQIHKLIWPVEKRGV